LVPDAGIISQMLTGIAITLMLVPLPAQPSPAQDRVIGLLTLPEVFGSEVCSPFKPESVALHVEPNGRRLGSIEVDQYWSFAPHGGCEGLEVRVHTGSARSELPTREHGYEEPAAIVLAQQGRWLKIRLADGAAWVNPTPRDQFKPLAALFDQAQTSITEHFSGRLRTTPGGSMIGDRFTQNQTVKVLEVREAGGAQWLNVEVLDYSPCTVPTGKEPQVIVRGWMPAHAESGEPTVWFSSRGC
jgi:hypothetical protein